MTTSPAEDVREFISFTALQDYMGLRSVGRSHIIAWHKDMERRGLAPAKHSAQALGASSLFDYLCERNAVTGNPVDGVKRPMAYATKITQNNFPNHTRNKFSLA